MIKNNQKILIEIGILAIVLVVLISVCVEEKSQLTEEEAIKIANESEYTKSLFELYNGANIDGGKVDIKIKEIIRYKHYDVIYFLDNGTNITTGSFSYYRPKPREGLYPCSAGRGCPEWYSYIKRTEIVELESVAYIILYDIGGVLMRAVCIDNSTFNYHNETAYIFQQECRAHGENRDYLCSKYEHYCNTDDDCIGYTWQNDCMDGIRGEECRNTFWGEMPRSTGCVNYEESGNCHCIKNTCTTIE